ncbi:glycosyltransferase family 2 protein [Arthrobacter sp. ISL-48]|uniref:glycosyltransferase n=1 Tax=Arthrobacter sp. ISL-48 TaxID=2819110 RepID=UPI001BE57B8A|nr:glycosyltransferase family 2 protein [Arthrobacter sp. ISL-48]MBT2534480.1 glycosyltransferase family 2 protein [Arthrobacter sp. ISL-48]
MSPLSSIAVVITHYHSLKELATCLQSLKALPESWKLEVIVADSEVEPQVDAMVQAALPQASYLPHRHNVGYARLVNGGLALSAAPYVLVLNADVRLEPGMLEGMATHLENNPEVGLVAPRLTESDGRHQHSAFAFYRPWTIANRRTPLGRTPLGRWDLGRFEMHREVDEAIRLGIPMEADWVMGACMLVRRTAIGQVGPLAEEYFMYFEDVDWCLRFWQTGWKVHYLPTVSCMHGWGRASKKGGPAAVFTNRLARQHIASAMKFFRKHGAYTKRPLVRPPARVRPGAAA